MINANFLSGLQHICCSTARAKKVMLLGYVRDLEHLQNTTKWMPLPATTTSEKDWKITQLCGIVEQLINF